MTWTVFTEVLDAIRRLAEGGVINYTEARAMIVAAADELGLSAVVATIRIAA